MGKKNKVDPRIKLEKALSNDYEGTKEKRQEDVCDAWKELHIDPDKRTQSVNGIVYTPVEVVDFIIESVAVLAREEFGVELDSENVSVCDPFAGTGIFGARYADLGYNVDNFTCYEIDPETAEVANRNISVSAGESFNGCETRDTFAMYEQPDKASLLSIENKEQE